MRFVRILLLILLLGAAQIHAGETLMVPLLSGIYKLDVPTGWFVQEEPDGTAVSVAPEQGYPAQAVVYAPNIMVDDFADYAGQVLETVWYGFGGSGQPDITDDLLSGFPARRGASISRRRGIRCRPTWSTWTWRW